MKRFIVNLYLSGLLLFYIYYLYLYKYKNTNLVKTCKKSFQSFQCLLLLSFIEIKSMFYNAK